MNKLILPDEDGPEYSGTILALVRNGYAVHSFRIAVQQFDAKGKSYTEWKRWIYYCRIELLHDFVNLVGKLEESNDKKQQIS